jgi:enoyl-CoA hydratase
MEMILTGDPINAQQAFEMGLVNRLIPVERYLDEAKDLARVIADRPPVAVRLARQAVRHGIENTFREGMELERRSFMLLFDTYDQEEGMRAFLEKREPRFKGK